MKAIVSGSFDPITCGHLDLIERASKMFDSVTVAICSNGEKHDMFTVSQRLEMVSVACAHLPNVKADICSGLLAEYTEANGIDYIVRGIRNGVDASYEVTLAEINRSLRNKPETIILPTKKEHMHISSTFAREMIKYSEPLQGIIPDGVIEYLKSKKI